MIPFVMSGINFFLLVSYSSCVSFRWRAALGLCRKGIRDAKLVEVLIDMIHVNLPMVQIEWLELLASQRCLYNRMIKALISCMSVSDQTLREAAYASLAVDVNMIKQLLM